MKTYLLVVFVLFQLAAKGQNLEEALAFERGENAVRVLFYNVENLFDTINDADVRDEEFLPTSDKKWNTPKYRIKVANIAKVIRAAGGWQAPELVCMAEVENRSVLLDIANHPAVQKGNYEVLHFDSNDPRGIDVALLYNANRFIVLSAEPIKVNMPELRTRDILFAELLVDENDTLFVFVNHWSSRRGGKAQSEPKRIAAANTIRAKTDSLFALNANAAIVVLGDLNDEPSDKSVGKLTAGSNPTFKNMMSGLSTNEGSHKYKGVWSYIDQILVSDEIARGRNLEVRNKRAYVYREPYMLIEDERYGDFYPYRTWRGPIFSAGFSDHLPVFIDLIYK